ncbi:MAG: cytochrome c biogenesis protein CcdA [Ferruginibacter sp.]
MPSIFTVITGVCFFLLSLNGFAQDSSNVMWATTSVETVPGSFQITLKATIKKGWHVYAKADEVEGLAGIQIQSLDSNVKIGNTSVNAQYQDIKDVVFDGKIKNVAIADLVVQVPITILGKIPPLFKLSIGYETGLADNFIPELQELRIALDESPIPANANRILIPSINVDKPVTSYKANDPSTDINTKSKGLGTIFFLGFLGGLVALLTPCVFPMIPLTVSFFTKQSQSRKLGIKNAFTYGFFIFFIYVLLSAPFHFIQSLDPEILNNISTNPYLNVLFFIIFIVFALSFFGLYEITLPGSLSSGVDSKAGVGNLAGIFFMALTLALVSFSCTGPILGSLLAGSLTADGGAWQLTAGMGGFGLALALPFALFALFPHWMNSLPKSGGWLNTVKVVLGFLELALALKFLSNADLVMHWGILKREVFIGIWIVVFAGLTLYLFGLIKFSHDSPIKKLHPFRKFLALVIGAFTLYLLPGVTNTKYANLSLISGFPPPLYYSIYKKASDCVLDLNCTRDYEEGLKMARAQNKPMLIDFTGFACVNCRRMEENIWTKPAVYNLLKEKFIIVSLYVDDKKELPIEKQFTYTNKDGVKKEIVTVGDKWATFETENFRNNAQPWYAIVNIAEKLMHYPVGYVNDESEYLKWLQAGLKAFEENQ